MYRLLKHSEIDFGKYDSCIEHSVQSTVYAASWYLNAVFVDWSVYVYHDYEAVMPIPLKSKFGIRYALQPQFCQQLGIFSPKDLSAVQYEKFISALPFVYCLNFNHANLQYIRPKNVRPNFVLSLNSDYQTLKSAFSSQCLRNIKKASSFCQSVCEMTVDSYMSFLAENSASWLNAGQLDILKGLILAAQNAGKAEILSVCSPDAEVLAAVFFVNWKNRKYYLSPVSSANGKKMQSMTFLINNIIEKNSGTDVIIDFEGSAIPGVQTFYRGFGAVDEPYPIISKHWHK
ncbi:MAG: hypothetical protein HUK15_01845 [Bacteroidales bacterium]|nr:hypothetical protein [Bacteroidales bacterium]